MSRVRARVALPVIGAALMTAVLPGPAGAGTYSVANCGSTNQTAAWVVLQGSLNSFKQCPYTTFGGGEGMVTRLAGAHNVGQYSRLGFFAPSGTSIAGLTISFLYTRNDCRVASQIRAIGPGVDRIVAGEGANQRCQSTSFEINNFAPAIPAGTTYLLQNTQCGAQRCEQGAAFRTRAATVTVNDPTPPDVAITGGGLASGRWVAGRQVATFAHSDSAGIRSADIALGGDTASTGFPCDYQPRRSVPRRQRRQLARGEHTRGARRRAHLHRPRRRCRVQRNRQVWDGQGGQPRAWTSECRPRRRGRVASLEQLPCSLVQWR